jgi:hypothetical protein
MAGDIDGSEQLCCGTKRILIVSGDRFFIIASHNKRSLMTTRKVLDRKRRDTDKPMRVCQHTRCTITQDRRRKIIPSQARQPLEVPILIIWLLVSSNISACAKKVTVMCQRGEYQRFAKIEEEWEKPRVIEIF